MKATPASEVPAKTERPRYVAFAWASSPSRTPSSWRAMASRPAALSEPLPPWTVRSLALRRSVTEALSAKSTVLSQPTPSSALRENCSAARTCERSDIAVAVPAGSSDGLVMSLPLDIRACRSDIFARLSWTLASVVRCTVCCVTRLITCYLPTTPVRLMSWSSISSIAVSTRAAPSYAR